jgi:hypothetical protein
MGSPEAIGTWAERRRVGGLRQLGGPAGVAADTGTQLIRVAFADRTSTDDQQDPTMSLPPATPQQPEGAARPRGDRRALLRHRVRPDGPGGPGPRTRAREVPDPHSARRWHPGPAGRGHPAGPLARRGDRSLRDLDATRRRSARSASDRCAGPSRTRRPEAGV